MTRQVRSHRTAPQVAVRTEPDENRAQQVRLELACPEQQVLDAMGTVSPAFATVEVERLCKALQSPGCTPSEPQFNAALGAVNGVGARNEVEAMLAVQMAATHALGMEVMGKARQAVATPHAETYANIATKFQRTFLAQVEALSRLRRGGEQTVRVEHVHVYPGAQAIVGNVTRGVEGVEPEDEQQPREPRDERAVPFAASTPVWSEEQSRAAMPSPENQGEVEVLAARRRARQRRSER